MPPACFRIVWEAIRPAHGSTSSPATQDERVWFNLTTSCSLAARPPHPRREGEEGGPVRPVGVAAFVLAEGDAALRAGFADCRVGVADQPRHAEQPVDGRRRARGLPGAARIDPGIFVEIARADEQW